MTPATHLPNRKGSIFMHAVAPLFMNAGILLAASLPLAGCGHTPLEADYGHSVQNLSESQVYDRTTLTRPSTAAVVGGDPDMLNLGLTNLRTSATDRKEVAKPVNISINQGAQ
jgi:hypothetical protein